MEKLRIIYNYRGNGIGFEIKWRDQLDLKKNFPTAQPAEGIFIQYDIKSDFVNYHPNLETYVLPALVGFLNPDDLKKIRHIEFIKMPEGVVTYKIENNNEPEKTPVFGYSL